MSDRKLVWAESPELPDTVAIGSWYPNGSTIVRRLHTGTFRWTVLDRQGKGFTDEALSLELGRRACEAQVLAWPLPIEGAKAA
jgi:hypothetical protein